MTKSETTTTHKQAHEILTSYGFLLHKEKQQLRNYITQQQSREKEDTELLERALEALVHAGMGDWLIAEPLRARLGKENSNG